MLVKSSHDSIELKWNAPLDGGCPVESYSIYADLGNGEFTSNLEAIDVEEEPYKFSHTFSFDSQHTGKVLRFKLVARNEIGSSISEDYLQVQLAGKPNAPLTQVTKLISKVDRIVVQMPLIVDNAGSVLSSYELQADDGLQSEFCTIYTGLNRTVGLETIVGRTYRFKYRVKNSIGWSDFSDVTYILAAEAPSKPCSKPELFSVDAT